MLTVVTVDNNKTFWFSRDTTREMVTYDFPWEKHSFLRLIIIIEKICHWNLFIVRANDIFIGFCNLLKDIPRRIHEYHRDSWNVSELFGRGTVDVYCCCAAWGHNNAGFGAEAFIFLFVIFFKLQFLNSLCLLNNSRSNIQEMIF